MTRISQIINTRNEAGIFTLNPLPNPNNYLSPYISEDTIKHHYYGHLATYINNLNNLVKNTPLENKSIEEVIKSSTGPVYNNASQIYNHYFYFDALANGGNKPKEKAMKLINSNFGSYDNFAEKFIAAGKSLFGSGWVWLVQEGEKLEIVSTTGAGTPIIDNQNPLLTMDVWEHAYYLDYPNNRGEYINNFLKIINWDIIEERIKG